MCFGYLPMSLKLRLNYFELSGWKFLSELREKEEINKEAKDGWSSQFFFFCSLAQTQSQGRKTSIPSSPWADRALLLGELLSLKAATGLLPQTSSHTGLI